MRRTEIINLFAEKYHSASYLEIGTSGGENFSRINVADKIGIDPDPKSVATLHQTSDEFFAANLRKFDLFMVDGLHEAVQVKKDVENCLKCANDNFTIILHDMLPTDEKMQMVPRVQEIWTGDCWKAFVRLRQERGDLEMYVVQVDYGCGVIRKGAQKLLGPDLVVDYQNFSRHRSEWMKTLSVAEFLQRMKDPS